MILGQTVKQECQRAKYLANSLFRILKLQDKVEFDDLMNLLEVIIPGICESLND